MKYMKNTSAIAAISNMFGIAAAPPNQGFPSKSAIRRHRKRMHFASKQHDNTRSKRRNLKLMQKIGGQYPEFLRLEARNIANGKWA